MDVSLGRKGRGRWGWQGRRTHLCMLLLVTFAIWAPRLDRGFPSRSNPTHTHTQAASIMHKQVSTCTLASKYTLTDTTVFPYKPLWSLRWWFWCNIKLLALYAVCIQTWHRSHYLNSSLRPSALPRGLLNTSPDSPQIVPLKLIVKVFGVWDCNSSRHVLYCSLVDLGDAASTTQMEPESAALVMILCALIT